MSILDRNAKDTVSLLKRDGQVFEGLKATVLEGSILLNRPDILIESKDLIRRDMSNGGQETYEIIDPRFREKVLSVGAHYNLKVKNLSVPEAEKAIQSFTVNVTGSNARINTNTIDNSTNIYTTNPDVAEKLVELRDEVRRVGTVEDLEIVDAIESQYQSGTPSKAVISSLLKALPAASSVASIGSFLFGLLG